MSNLQIQNAECFQFQSFPNPELTTNPSGSDTFEDIMNNRVNKWVNSHRCNYTIDLEYGKLFCICLRLDEKKPLLPLFILDESNYICFHDMGLNWDCSTSTKTSHIIIPKQNWLRPLRQDERDLPSHLLHGLIHSDGSGHLLTLNGIENGSQYVCGNKIMDLWDRLCTFLQLRQVSLVDVSTKHGMALRLLHGISYDHTWFGNWGYRVIEPERSSFKRVIGMMSSLDLKTFLHDYSEILTDQDRGSVNQLVQYYRERHCVLASSPTLRQLFRLVLSLVTLQKVPAAAPVSSLDIVANPEDKVVSCLVDLLKEHQRVFPNNPILTKHELIARAKNPMLGLSPSTTDLEYLLSKDSIRFGSNIIRKKVQGRGRRIMFGIDEEPVSEPLDYRHLRQLYELLLKTPHADILLSHQMFIKVFEKNGMDDGNQVTGTPADDDDGNDDQTQNQGSQGVDESQGIGHEDEVQDDQTNTLQNQVSQGIGHEDGLGHEDGSQGINHEDEEVQGDDQTQTLQSQGIGGHEGLGNEDGSQGIGHEDEIQGDDQTQTLQSQWIGHEDGSQGIGHEDGSQGIGHEHEVQGDTAAAGADSGDDILIKLQNKMDEFSSASEFPGLGLGFDEDDGLGLDDYEIQQLFGSAAVQAGNSSSQAGDGGNGAGSSFFNDDLLP